VQCCGGIALSLFLCDMCQYDKMQIIWINLNYKRDRSIILMETELDRRAMSYCYNFN
jgi:hypothetical protein